MGAHADLIAVADALAASARAAVTPAARAQGARVGADELVRAGELASDAKRALEAAAIAHNIGPGEIDAALGQIQEELEKAGVLAESFELDPADFLRQTFEAVAHWRREAEAAQGLAAAFERLRDLVVTLERDFTAAGTDTSRRIAARINTALDDAQQLLNTTPEGSAT